MPDFLLYNLKAAGCLVVFYLFYKLFLSRETFHRLNRLLLLGGIAVSLLLPLCVITVERELPAGPQAGVQVQIPFPEYDESPDTTTVSWDTVWLVLFVSGAASTAAWMFLQIVRTVRVIRRGRLEELDGGIVLSRHAGVQSPFSWGRWIVLSDADAADCGAQILAHERAHIRCRHSFDLLALDLIGCLQWFNPAMWLLRSELRMIHEYEADAAVLAAGADARQYQLLLIKKAVGGRWYSVANSLNHSKLKNRITMMLRKKSSGWTRARALLVVPLVCVALGAFARTAYVPPKDKGSNKIESSVIHVTNQQVSQGPLVVTSRGGTQSDSMNMTVDVQSSEDPGGSRKMITVVTQDRNLSPSDSTYVLHVMSGSAENKVDISRSTDKQLIVVDGREIGSIGEVDPDDVESVQVYSGKDVPQKYKGRKDIDGLIKITTKRAAGVPVVVTSRGGAQPDSLNLKVSVRNAANTEVRNKTVVVVTRDKDVMPFDSVKVIGVRGKPQGADSMYWVHVSSGPVGNKIDISQPTDEPTVVIDGVVMSEGEGALSRMDPAEIESISVLKGNSAVALYGERARAGAIVVTTKKPK